MDIKPIRTEKDYEDALKEVERLWGTTPGTPDGDLFEVLFTLVESYEGQHYPILPPDPVEAIEYYMDSRGLDRQDLGAIYWVKWPCIGSIKPKTDSSL